MYIEIDGVEYPCEVATTISQLGQTVIRVISEEAPVAEDGFVLINEEKVYDKSSFKYLYRMDGNVKEYTAVEEEIIPASGYVSGIPENPLARQLSALNQRITDITPYEQSKTAYVYDTEVVFENVPTGNVSVYMVGADGKNVEHEVTQENGNVIVSFEKRETLATVTLSINQ